MCKRRTHSEYVADVAELHPNIDVIEEFTNVKTKILHRCRIDGCEWRPYPSSILQGYGCPECNKRNRTKTHENYLTELLVVNANIEPLERYINSVTPILHRCKIDGCIWKVAPGDTLRGHGCPKCNGVYRKSTEEYKEEVRSKYTDIDVVEEYVNKYTPILHKCKKCGHLWPIRPNNVLSSTVGCPECDGGSRGEKQIKQYLNDNNIVFISQYKFIDCRDINPLPFDFFLPKYNLCIEYDGRQHFEPVDVFDGIEGLKYNQRHDNIKNQFCLTNNIDLLRIRYDQNIYETLKQFLYHKYNLII